MKKSTRELALSGLFVGLGVVVLLLGALLSVLDLSAAAVVALLVAVATLELSPWYPPLIYLATAVLALLLLPDKFSALTYLLITGHYPILKPLFEKLPRLFALLCKFALFNLSLVLITVIGVWLLSVDLSFTGTILEGYAPVVLTGLFLIGNVVFYMFDIILTRFSALYLHRWRSRLGLDRFLQNNPKR